MRRSTIIEIFEKELIRVDGKPVRVKMFEDVFAYILRVAKEFNANLVVRSDFDLAEEMAFDRVLNELGVKIVNVSTKHNPIDIIKYADIGITGTDFAIAETGSIGIITYREIDRLVSALPFIHIAILHSKKIFSTFDDLKEVFKSNFNSHTGRNSVISLITGPSRTADIEQKHILGVHGPNQLNVIIIED